MFSTLLKTNMSLLKFFSKCLIIVLDIYFAFQCISLANLARSLFFFISMIIDKGIHASCITAAVFT